MRRAFRVFFSVLLPLTCAAPAIAAGPFPGIDVKDLDPDEVGDLVEFMKEGACPCDPKKTILACIQESSCDKATDLARYGIDKLRDGMGIDQVREAVVRQLISTVLGIQRIPKSRR